MIHGHTYIRRFFFVCMKLICVAFLSFSEIFRLIYILIDLKLTETHQKTKAESFLFTVMYKLLVVFTQTTSRKLLEWPRMHNFSSNSTLISTPTPTHLTYRAQNFHAYSLIYFELPCGISSFSENQKSS